ncbi:MAG TPA: HEAT repeat domain-containing protein [Candidatus Acidoferrum sp.]|jgi:HEAT repeat protein|nr:HEAT repeat domain-containing protein [Candidatus Acidoferrum sp.]
MRTDFHRKPRLSLLAVLAGVAAHLVGCEGEPRHQGKTLSDWLTVYQSAQEGSSKELGAGAAVRAIGTNALSYLTKWVISNDPIRAAQARQGFIILGPAAAPAVPVLAPMLASTNDLVALSASLALGTIGAPAAPALMDALTNKDYRISLNAFLALPELGTNARLAIPFLLEELKHPDHRHRERAAAALGGLRIEPEIVVPALIQSLHDSSPAVRFHAITGLGDFGPSARSAALPIMQTMEHDESLRRLAKTSLLQIAPDLLTNAPAR